MSEGRSELEKAACGWQWEALRQSYYANHGNLRQAEACRLLADKWQQRRDALWGEEQGGQTDA